MSARKKRIRARFRNSVWSRDNHQCVMCGAAGVDLDAHHITDRHMMPNEGYVPENGISLCDTCHWKAEEYHRTDHQEWEEGWHPDDLYDKIGSSYEKAYAASKRLL